MNERADSKSAWASPKVASAFLILDTASLFAVARAVNSWAENSLAASAAATNRYQTVVIPAAEADVTEGTRLLR